MDARDEVKGTLPRGKQYELFYLEPEMLRPSRQKEISRARFADTNPCGETTSFSPGKFKGF